MKKIKLLFLLFAFYQPVAAQKTVVNPYENIDKKISEIPDSSNHTITSIADYINLNFTTNKDKARAIFIWAATNIQYDIENMFAINFYETQENKTKKTLVTKKGICENYAALFNAISSQCGLRSYIIGGYTKQNGFRDYIPHAWCAAFIDTAWFMFDPTWGSGYVTNGKFIKKVNNNYFMVKPEVLIKSHMPFDYLWQFLNYPVTSQEFYEGNVAQNKSKSFFNFIDSINVYEHQDHITQLTAEADRIQENGVKNAMIFNQLQNIKVEIENEKITANSNKQNKDIRFYNTAAANYNTAVNNLNAFIDYRNRQFKPEKPDAEIQGMIDITNQQLDSAKTNMRQIQHPEADAELLINQLAKAIVDLETHVKEQQDWLTIYFSKSKSKRKTMFYEKKITWYGLPVN